jgi:hypothetical protein
LTFEVIAWNANRRQTGGPWATLIRQRGLQSRGLPSTYAASPNSALP